MNCLIEIELISLLSHNLGQLGQGHMELCYLGECKSTFCAIWNPAAAMMNSKIISVYTIKSHSKLHEEKMHR